jgi:peroxiredoxin
VRSAKAEFDRRNVSVVVVSFAEPSMLVPYLEKHRWPFPILADPQRNAYRAFGLKRLSWFRVFSPATLKLYWKLFREGMKPQNYGKQDIYQSGGDFLLDREGNILFAHRSREPADRPSVNRLLQAIDAMMVR